MSEVKRSYVRIGKVIKKKDGKGFTIKLGDPDGRYKPFKLKVMVEYPDGSTFEMANPWVQIQDPRSNPNLTPEQVAKIPEFIINDLIMIVEE
jgi:hypothetical protein